MCEMRVFVLDFPKPRQGYARPKKHVVFSVSENPEMRAEGRKKSLPENGRLTKSFVDLGSVNQTNSLPASEQIIVPILIIEAVGELKHERLIGAFRGLK